MCIQMRCTALSWTNQKMHFSSFDSRFASKVAPFGRLRTRTAGEKSEWKMMSVEKTEMNMRWIKVGLILARDRRHRLRLRRPSHTKIQEIKKCMLENRKCVIKVKNLSSQRVRRNFFRNLCELFLSLSVCMCRKTTVWDSGDVHGAWTWTKFMVFRVINEINRHANE